MNGKRRKVLQKDLFIFKSIIIAIFLVLMGRLAWLQLVETDIYKTRAESNRMRLVPISATRGNIITSDGVTVATDTLLSGYYYLSGLKNQDQVVNKLAEILK